MVIKLVGMGNGDEDTLIVLVMMMTLLLLTMSDVDDNDDDDDYDNPFIPKSHQISPAASPEITSHSMKILALHSLLRWKMMKQLPILTTPLINFSLKGWENVLFELGNGRA